MTVDNIGGSDNQNSSDVEDNSVDNVNQAPNLGAIRKSGQQEVLNVLAKVTGQNFNSTKDAAAFIEQLVKAQQTNNGDSAQSRQKDTGSKSNSEMAELRHMIESLNSKLAEKDVVVRKTSLQSQIKDVAVKNGFDPSMLDMSTSLFEQQIAFDDTGDFYVKGKDGNVRLDAQGNPMSLDQLAAEILKARPKLAIDDARTGTGSRFGFNGTRNTGEMPDAATDPVAWKAWKQANGVGGKSLSGVGVTVNKGLV